MRHYGMTRQQRELLDFIRARIEETNVAPSFDEMRDNLGLKSKSGIHRLVTALEERGHIVRLHNRSRAIALRHILDGGSIPADIADQIARIARLRRVPAEVALRQAVDLYARTAA